MTPFAHVLHPLSMAKASSNLLATVVLPVLALAFLMAPSHAGDRVWTWIGRSGTARQIVVASTGPSMVNAVAEFDRDFQLDRLRCHLDARYVLQSCTTGWLHKADCGGAR